MRVWFAVFSLFAPIAAAAATSYTWPTVAPCTAMLQDCATQASDSDAIKIATATPIAENIRIEKALSFVAAPGFHPVFAAGGNLIIEVSSDASTSDANVTVNGFTF